MGKGYRRVNRKVLLAQVNADRAATQEFAEAFANRMQHSGPLPHGVGCPGCRSAGECNECGASYVRPTGETPRGKTVFDVDRCTNGRCMSCHATVCGQGEAHAPYRKG